MSSIDRSYRFIVTGAGFSKALCPDMPLTSDLDSELFESAGTEQFKNGLADYPDLGHLRHRFSDLFEQTGERIERFGAFLWESDNFANNKEEALFRSAREEFISWIAVQVMERQCLPCNEVTSIIKRFLAHSADNKVRFATFNYDTIVESVIESWSNDGVTWNLLPMIDLKTFLGGRRSVDGGRAVIHDIPYLKVHGSTDWRKLAGSVNATLESAFRIVADEPMAVAHHDDPPVLVPMSFARNATTQGSLFGATWRAFCGLLAGAAKVDFVGFSFPSTDMRILMEAAKRRHVVNDIVVLTSGAVERSKLDSRLKKVFPEARVYHEGAVEWMREQVETDGPV